MEIRCTRPSCANPRNLFPDLDDKAILKTVQQRFCTTCGMPLLLDGRYLPLKLLGKGGFGTAYLASDRRTPAYHYCVVKQFQPQAELDPEQLKIAHNLFEREAEVLERLGSNHPQIPKLLAYFPLSVADPHTGQQCQFFYLVQEYIDGRTLEQILKEKGQFSEPEVLEMLRSVLGILDYIHQNGAIHRDIKPSNIMQHNNGMFYLLDFGTVKQVTQGAVTSTGSSTGVFTSGYAPPEQVAGQNIYPSTDLYALAVTALVLLTGKLNPLDCFDGYSNRWQWQTQANPVSDRTAHVLNRMLETVPSHRYDRASEVLQALGFPPGNTGLPPGPYSGDAYAKTVTYPPGKPPGVPPTVAYPSNPPGSGYPSNPPGQPSGPAGYPLHLDPTLSQPPIGPPSPPPGGGYGSGGPQPGYPSGSQSGVDSRGSKPPQARWQKPLMVAGVIALVGLGGYGLWSLLGTGPILLGGDSKTERVSDGDRRLIADDGTADKQEAIAAYERQDFEEAANGFEASLTRDRNDPESLIYFHNAKIGNDKSYTIAVSIPLDSEDIVTQNAAKELLRGVAQAQHELNQKGGIDGTPLKVLIATETNQEDSTEKVAKKLVKDKNILGVIGHFGSGASLAAADVYQNNQVVMISATSTSTELSNFGNYIFRTVPSDNFTGRALSRYTLESLKKQKAAVFYNADSSYSRSLRDVFTESLLSNGGEVVQEFDLNQKEFNARSDYRQAQERGAEVIVLLANSETLPQAYEVLRTNRKRLPVLGGDSPYREDTLLEGSEDAEGLVLAVPWHSQGDPGAGFPKAAEELWGGSVSWRTAMSYDAAQSLIAAIEKNPTRQGVREALASPDFSPPGSAGTIRFLRSGDRDRPTQLVKVVPGNHQSGYVFVPTAPESN
ncbi:bifunctional serine/threonine-protein kinase/ABC transporter substrate-binding protein [Lyngbya confervoides]|uniref:Bifunctional serine/threonine-protein kinase/ABC transporter substrate-binding protein n=1 Tax=Lyngbya confervoides BDU141951 TaxID=1574623 RepID=A0ABD4SYG2_9CYAN|nr:bifunctional serine/threonine-protein kinase/ABC transporter substrate-binding protein [Lyngbya confervoides]MCM1981512.1 bifunctional serine/threonine-protein kinase/ABC transporter substrate-binding protein [Lyngbya confervoides BDU141951]